MSVSLKTIVGSTKKVIFFDVLESNIKMFFGGKHSNMDGWRTMAESTISIISLSVWNKMGRL